MGGLRLSASGLRRAALSISLAAVPGCGALLGVDHDFGLVDGGDDASALADASTDESVHGEAAAVEGAVDSGAPDTHEAEAGDAASDGACSVGTLECSDAQPELCNNAGTWQPVGAACSGTKPACLSGACVDCSPGAIGCNGQQPVQCDSSGAWQASGTACGGQACVGGQCTGVCAPNALACINTYWFVCNGDGQWQPVGTQC